MKFCRRFLTVIILMFLTMLPVMAENTTLICQGGWGKEVNQLGVRFPSPGVMPTAPYQCVGGYDVDANGMVWFSDSVNSQLKSFKDKNWAYIMLNFGRLGDLVCFNKRLYVLTREPDGIAIVNPENGKVEKHIKIDLKNPGRLKVVSESHFLIEEQGVGLMIYKNDKAVMHPAVALEPVTDGKRIFGVQYNLEKDSRSIIAAEIADELQEPEMLGLYEAGETIVFIKTAGINADKPVIMLVTASQPAVLKFIRLGEAASPEKTVTLPLFETSFLPASWKLCSDGNLYGFAGTASDGFKLLKSDAGF